ncbi:hypothetical protein HDV05_000439 [Chytridiales sp. JEL 0842]|nr:hypothetical protein HDV05_000439 [Chytridiales sp. JEL 0842]
MLLTPRIRLGSTRSSSSCVHLFIPQCLTLPHPELSQTNRPHHHLPLLQRSLTTTSTPSPHPSSPFKPRKKFNPKRYTLVDLLPSNIRPLLESAYPNLQIPFLKSPDLSPSNPPFEIGAETTELTVLDVSIDSLGICIDPLSGWLFLVPTVLPNEKVRARIYQTDARHGISRGDLVSVLEKAEGRVEPKCQHFHICSGCSWQHLSYPSQLSFKNKYVQDIVSSTYPNVVVNPVVPSPEQWGFRSKITPHYPQFEKDETGEFKMGFLVRGRRKEVFNLRRCEVAAESINAALPQIRKETQERKRVMGADALGGTVMIRETLEPPEELGGKGALEWRTRGSWRAGVSELDETKRLADFINRLKQSPSTSPQPSPTPTSTPSTLASRLQLSPHTTPWPHPYPPTNWNRVSTTARKRISTQIINSQIFRFESNTFFQVNTSLLPSLSAHIRSQLQAHTPTTPTTTTTTLIDLYCGSGIFAIQSADLFQNVLGVELDKESAYWANQNALDNGISNIRFHASSVSDFLSTPPKNLQNEEISIILDPSKRGCGEKVMRGVARLKPRCVVYVSCEPDSQFKDLEVLLGDGKSGYRIVDVTPFDMFPHAGRVECVVTIVRDD